MILILTFTHRHSLSSSLSTQLLTRSTHLSTSATHSCCNFAFDERHAQQQPTRSAITMAKEIANGVECYRRMPSNQKNFNVEPVGPVEPVEPEEPEEFEDNGEHENTVETAKLAKL